MAKVRHFINLEALRRIADVVSLVGHFAGNCDSTERLCYNCFQPGHESANCPQPHSPSAKQCYACGGQGHIQADCPSIRIRTNQKCFVRTSFKARFRGSDCPTSQTCQQTGHIARFCPKGTGVNGQIRGGPGRPINATDEAIRCRRCKGLYHLAR